VEVVVVNDLSAVMSGLSLGRTALSGLVPTSSSPRGGPPPVDPLASRFRSVLAELDALSAGLNRVGDQQRMVEVQELKVKLQRMSVDRQSDIMKAGSGSAGAGPSSGFAANFPNINGGGVV
jgi:hypothetical protein